ncbi:MAG: BON domain-containing protein [Planctomycetaceae bacterium]
MTITSLLNAGRRVSDRTLSAPQPVSDFADNLRQHVTLSEPDSPRSADDDRLLETIQQSFRRSGFGELQRVAVGVSRGNVWLRGQVPSWHLKQIAQQSVLAIPDVDRLTNDVQVSSEQSPIGSAC